MAVEYNLTEKSRTLIGNWSENRALEARGEKARVEGRAAKGIRTAERVLPAYGASGPEHWLSETVDSSKAILSKATHSTLGPRARLQQQRVLETADAFATALLTPAPEAVTVGTSTTSEEFKAYDASHYKAPMRRPQLGTSAAAASGAATGAPLSRRPSGDAFEAADTSVPVTYYTQRAVEGVYPKGPIRNIGNPFAKSYAFTNPIMEGERSHAEATEKADPELVTYLGRSTSILAGAGVAAAPLDRRIPGATLALQRLFLRLLRRLAECPGAGPAGAHGALAALLRDIRSVAGSYVGSLDRTAAGLKLEESHALPESVRARLHDMRVALPDRDVETALAACDEDASGRVSLPLLLQVFLSTIPAPRRAALSAIYRSVAGGGRGAAGGAGAFASTSGGDGGALASVPDLAARFNADAMSEVASGRASASDMLAGFVGFFVELGGEDEASEDVFAVFFAPLSACIEADADFDRYLRDVWGYVPSSGPAAAVAGAGAGR